jgi:hypothetical protein
MLCRNHVTITAWHYVVVPELHGCDVIIPLCRPCGLSLMAMGKPQTLRDLPYSAVPGKEVS